ncbi:MAG: radical SAM protein [Oligoflexia bacterium]|nr:radical SAM protein [Oligoflexia bacterium]
MKIAFISPNQEKMPTPVVPLGLLYVMGSLDETYDKELWDLCFEENPLAFLIKSINVYNPDIVAIGIRNIHNNSYSSMDENIDYYKRIIATIREHSQSPIIIGGSGFSVMPEKLMEILKVDFGIIGEAENIFPLLIRKISTRADDFETISNLYFFKNGEIKFSNSLGTVVRTFIDLHKNCLPARKYTNPYYYTITGTESIQSKRGCNFKCCYCAYPRIEGPISRLRSPVDVAKEMFTRAQEVDTISNFFIVDSVFNWPPDHAKNICKELVRGHFHLPWSCYINPRGFDEEMACLMAKAGCNGVEIGADSGNNSVLLRLRKGFTTDTITTTHKFCEQFNIKDCYTLLVGTPGESLEEINSSLDFFENLYPTALIIMIWQDESKSLNKNTVINEISHTIKIRSQKNPNWIVPSLNINFNEKMFRFMRRRGYPYPLWIHLGK